MVIGPAASGVSGLSLGTVITAACCSTFGIESGESLHRLHRGASSSLIPLGSELPDRLGYVEGCNGTYSVSRRRLGLEVVAYTADQA